MVGPETPSGDGVERLVLQVLGQDDPFFGVNVEKGIFFLFYENFILYVFLNY